MNVVVARKLVPFDYDIARQLAYQLISVSLWKSKAGVESFGCLVQVSSNQTSQILIWR